VARREDAKGSGPTRAASITAVWLLLVAVGALAAACTDPRARPVPPTVLITLAPGTVVASPGSLLGSLYVYDANGIDSMRVLVELGNGTTLADSTFFTSNDPFQATLPLNWRVPGGVPNRTVVRVVARVRSFIGFVAADTLATAVGDTL
jgi:hypothetical protein